MRQNLLYTMFVISLLATRSLAHESPPTTAPAPAVTADDALRMLKEGNTRYRNNVTEESARGQDRRDEVSGKQQPYAIILSCSDSRAPVEVLFDAGIGELFVVRVAGNVANTDEIGTIEYGVEHLHTPLVVVLGHSKCGAVTAVVEHAHVSELIGKLVAPIVPAAERAHRDHPELSGAPLVAAATKENVWQGISDMLTRSEIVRGGVARGAVQVVGGIYDLQTGDIEWLGQHPDQAKLIKSAGVPTTQEHDAHDSRKSAVPAKRRENFAALGALLGGAGVVSMLALKLIDARRR